MPGKKSSSSTNASKSGLPKKESSKKIQQSKHVSTKIKTKIHDQRKTKSDTKYFGAKKLPRTIAAVPIESCSSASSVRTKSPTRCVSQLQISVTNSRHARLPTIKCGPKGSKSNSTCSSKASSSRRTTQSSSSRTTSSSTSSAGSGDAKKKKKKKPNLLLAIRPSNVESEKTRFMVRHYQYDPRFVYLNPPAEDVLERFNKPSNKLLDQAIKIMHIALKKYGTYENFEAHTGGPQISRREFTQMFKEYVAMEGLENKVVLNLGDDILSRAIMTRSKGKPCLNVRVSTLREKWAPGMLRHELGTHVLRSANNKHQPWNNTKGRERHNLRHLNPTEEGLANLHSVLYRDDPSLWRAALLYYTAYKASLMSFSDLFHDLEKFVSDPEIRWQYCARVKRGLVDTSEPGCFSKDQVYLTGVFEILRYRHRIDFHSLVRMGKIAYQDIERLKPQATLDDKVVKIPFFMVDLQDYKARLHYIMTKNGITDVDLVRLYPDADWDDMWWTPGF
ncbi:microtubule-associated tyrosine carboxypeptidase 1-like [Amphiura filiformis]|uniref:microtubule-associated tyrosine carboxypeptidase 1-like n=1 Tax=Amphiura filiformis TaxID=82378 RepID=UPI003B226A88